MRDQSSVLKLFRLNLESLNELEVEGFEIPEKEPGQATQLHFNKPFGSKFIFYFKDISKQGQIFRRLHESRESALKHAELNASRPAVSSCVLVEIDMLSIVH